MGATVGSTPSFVTLDRDGQTIMLNCAPDPFRLRRTKGWAAYFWDDVEALYNEFVGRDTKLKGSIVEKPYGCKEVAAVAPDGRVVVFGQQI